MDPKFFTTQDDFRNWLAENHAIADELIVGYYKVGTGKPSMSWSESVDQALCFGWIDGVRRKYDDDSYTIRFTPRRPRSIWSAVNIAKVAELKKKGLMTRAGLAAFEKREEKRSAVYAYENRPEEFPAEYEKLFAKNRTAFEFFTAQPPSYRRLAVHRVISAKQEATRRARLQKLIAASAEKRRC